MTLHLKGFQGNMWHPKDGQTLTPMLTLPSASEILESVKNPLKYYFAYNFFLSVFMTNN